MDPTSDQHLAADFTYISPWWVLLPIGVFLLASAVTAVTYWRGKITIDDWMAKGRSRRQVFRFLLLYTAPVVAGAFIDWSDISQIVELQVRVTDIVLLSGVAIFVPLWVSGQALQSFHADKQDARLEDMQEEHTKETERYKAELKLERAQHDRTRATRKVLAELMNVVLEVVGHKANRLHGLNSRLAENGGRLSGGARQLLKDALNPEEQIFRLVVVLQKFFHGRVGPDFRVRVAYYQLQGDFLIPIETFDGTRGCIQSPLNQHRARFNIRSEVNAKECLAVWVSTTGLAKAVPDADAAHSAETPYRHFDDEQRAKIKSIYATPVRRRDEESPIAHVLTIDTDRKDFFGGDGWTPKEIEVVIQNLAHRLLFEVEMSEVFARLAKMETRP